MWRRFFIWQQGKQLPDMMQYLADFKEEITVEAEPGGWRPTDAKAGG